LSVATVYRDMTKHFPRHCWACRGRRKPEWWHAPWNPVERAHIVNKPRVEDRRAVVLLCPLCHNALDQRVTYANDDRPQLTVGNVICLSLGTTNMARIKRYKRLTQHAKGLTHYRAINGWQSQSSQNGDGRSCLGLLTKRLRCWILQSRTGYLSWPWSII